MLTKNAATKIAQNACPGGKIQRVVEYRDLYLFQIFSDSSAEGQMDPFYSVDKFTGEFRDFSILTDGDIEEITDLFVKEG